MIKKETYILITISILSGFVNGLLGLGGGTIIIPAMVAFAGVTQHEAHGTSLAVILPTSIVSTVIYGLHQSLDYSLTLKVVAGGLLGSYIGARLMNLLSAQRLRQFFGLFMFIAGLRMMF